ncbi:hypothetical protein K431DRAFT_214643 [Polychaeton citri CBS 116435]|uniref:NOT2/NOT3/NOT5 C-terminal domain-containing protein n=1 Tax=Polychaeton citri CBS 116435 TaxID=1314669 RepID=A0A9P4QED3_9PEZI|nr:hypothetical protein K431DRAFT_214643 [Polychaeton citri CBS 116435]
MGQDLSTLGLDLDSPDPLIPSFFPFPGEGRTGSMYDFHDRHVVPDFHIPSAYTVNNVPPLQTRIGSFSDETLFSIFYQHPHDTVQELAALELTNREWRWHKILRQWLQKDTRESSISSSSLPTIDLTNGAPYGAPSHRLGDRGERGIFIFFDAANWRRERREFVLNYEELDTRLAGGVPAAITAMTGSAAGMSAGPMGAAGAPLPGVGGSGASGIGSSGVGGAPTSAAA